MPQKITKSHKHVYSSVEYNLPRETTNKKIPNDFLQSQKI